ncbi:MULTISPECIES: Tim44 domain-containing protein [unclassified Endozoicomonas]|uniref:Tim44 domain-containing protein n=1 Tax=unclassified Endozoicomonas TaxID=2644528 RepID=UPI002148F3B6|nr:MULTISPECIES: TIM44-like domain-containing protein [unclassified Endozoicomonas]
MIKRFASFMAIIMAFSFVFNVPVADAKKFGGGKSFGRSYNTAPAPKQPAAAPQQGSKQTAAQSSRKGLLGGLLGGLLAGGLIAALFGGAFSGLQVMDILIIALLAFVLFKVFRSMNRAKAMAAGHHGGNDAHFTPEQSGQNQTPSSLGQLFGQNREQQEDNFGQAAQTPLPQTGFGTSDVPMNLPEGFNLSAFMNGARDHYRKLQEAWNENDLDTMREYLEPELFLQLKAERASLGGDQHTEVMFVDAELGRADYNDRVAEISVRFSGKYRDTVEGVEEDITDIWHLQRSLKEPDAPWLIVGIET